MDDDPSGDFDERLVQHLRLLIAEQAHLWELRADSTVVHGDSTEKVGPWSPRLCSLALLRWLDAGFIGLYRDRPTNEVEDLSVDEAKSALRDVAAWRPGLPAVLLFETDQGREASDEAWLRALTSYAPTCRDGLTVGVAFQDFDRARRLWEEHARTPFPDEIDKGEEYDGVDAVLTDADAAGVISTIISGRRTPDDQQQAVLEDLHHDLERLTAAVPPRAQPYFNRLSALVAELLR